MSRLMTASGWICGTATVTTSVATVSDNLITANSIIQYMRVCPAGNNVQGGTARPYISAVTPATSFVATNLGSAANLFWMFIR